ncbi:MAG: peptidase M14 carboxypeptidase [Prolixibacteraceae bacterium]|nr:MAG: peptidase M14 carboxypeptidase [Prolixibacteraceae bacterium]
MRKIIINFIVITIAFTSVSQEKPDYFLPTDVTYDKNIPTPEEYFNQQIGEWHLTHCQVLNYMQEIAKISNRAVIQEYARSYENRPLVHLIFTSEQNHNKLDELKALRLQHANPAENVDKSGVPLVINLGYGVHGNESSATNASVLTAYYLAAAQGDKIDKLLSNSIILVDPCLNPDGFTRHSTWANMHQSNTTNGDSYSRQFSEVWPGGRGNHYWFDLNRDYLLLVHPESVGRVAKFHEWLPNIVTDHHEMGANSTFFFQPGVPTRNNPLTPENNYVLTRKIAEYHSEYLDKIGAGYYSEEQFDDYYLGKGSSYPDINSSIGILFEQAGFRGRIRETTNGTRKLAYGIRNQFTVTLSTLDAAMNLKDELLDHQKEFYLEALRMADKDPVKAYIFGNQGNNLQTLQFVKLLQQHQIEVYTNSKEITKNGKIFNPVTSFVVLVKQRQYRMIKALFDEVATFTDSTFYDVSTWNMPYTFNVAFTEIGSLKEMQYSNKPVAFQSEGKIIGGQSKIGYLFCWNEYTAPKALYALQKAGLLTKVATREFSFKINNEMKDFGYGTIFIPANDQPLTENQIYQLAEKIAKENGIDFYGLTTGLSPKGIDLGSNYFVTINQPKILMFVGGSTSSASAGEIWHLFDQRYEIPVTLTETVNLTSIELSKYNTIILPGGAYREWNNNDIQKLKNWAQDGGTLIAMQSAASWAAKNELGKTTYKKAAEPDSTIIFSYADREKERSLNTISGAIFNTTLDITHPLCYGYTENTLPVFKTGNSVAKPLDIKYAEPVKFTAQPFLSGFVSDKNLELIKNAPVVSVQSIGRGKIISYHESMTFRGIWLGTNKLLANGVFFGKVIQ